jgi:hypothetical protein
MTALEGCIQFWKSLLVNSWAMSPSTVAIIEQTIRFLEKLKEKGGEE